MNTDQILHFEVRALHGFAEKVLEAAGLQPGHASVVADALLQADSRGAASHGLIRLPFLVARLRDGGANADPQFQVVVDAPSISVLDADGALGPLAASRGMELAIAKARETGVGVTTVRNSDFIGTCAHSAMLALTAGMIGMTWTNGHPGMAPWGGRANGIGNNPLAFAIPGGTGAPVVLDIAMSVVAGGKVRHAAKTGNTIPHGWVVDAMGNDTSQPEDFPAGGALLALGHKGYGLAVVGEVLGGVLAGASILGGIPQWFTATDSRVGNGHFHMALDLARFVPAEQFSQQMDLLRETLGKVERRPGVDEILLPGEAASRREKQARSHGVQLPEAVVADLGDLASRYGLHLPQALSERKA